MPSTENLVKAYGKVIIPDRIDDMTYQEAWDRQVMSAYEIRQDLMNLWLRDVKTIKGIESPI